MVSAGRIESIQTRAEHVNPARYDAFVDAFGINNVGLVSMDNVVKEIKTGEPAFVYLLGRDLEVKLSDERGVQGKLFLASGFDLGRGKMSGRKDLERVMGYLDSQIEKGNIGRVVNSRYSTLFEDKKSFVGLKGDGFSVPKTYHFEKNKDFVNFFVQNGKHVVKHRFGYDGVNNFLIDLSNINSFVENEKISDYVVQEVLPIISETRLIFYKDEFLGARKIMDRTRPWEKESSTKRKHLVEACSPSIKDIDSARQMFRHSRAVIGGVDTVQLESGEDKVLEFNGVSTGLGYPGGVYDLNSVVAQRLKELDS